MIPKLLTRIALAAAPAAMLSAAGAAAQDMPYVGEIQMFAFDFCPAGIGALPADGRLRPMNPGDPLYQIFDWRFGVDTSRQHFKIPDLRGRAWAGAGHSDREDDGSDLNLFAGEQAGAELVTMTMSQMPGHTHVAAMVASAQMPDSLDPAGNSMGTFPLPAHKVYNNDPTAPLQPMKQLSATLGRTGGGEPIPIRDPYLTLNYCVVQDGVYPVR